MRQTLESSWCGLALKVPLEMSLLQVVSRFNIYTHRKKKRTRTRYELVCALQFCVRQVLLVLWKFGLVILGFGLCLEIVLLLKHFFLEMFLLIEISCVVRHGFSFDPLESKEIRQRERITYLACKASAMTPDAIAAAADVAWNVSTQAPPASVVIYE